MNTDMWKYMWEWILKLFGIQSAIATDEQPDNEDFTRKYQDIEEINFTAILSNRVALIATADSDFILEEDNKRAKLLAGVGEKAWKKKEKLASLALGTGGCLIVPYVQDGQLLFNIATQDRLCIHEKNGDKITGATILADSAIVNKIRYLRYVNYIVKDNTLYITNKVTTEAGRETMIEQWKELRDVAIANVDRVPFGYIKSPVDNRHSTDDYGVPITYGCDAIIEEIKECLKQIRDEFELKEVRVMADKRMFAKDKKGNPTITSKLFYALSNFDNKGEAFSVYSPEIRESAYYSRLTHLLELLEKNAGTSRGILIKSDVSYENKDAVREANRATWAIVTALRDSITEGFEDFLYACNVLANYYELTPPGDYTFSFDWDFSLVESSTETWQQMLSLQSVGGMSKAELRAWVTGESQEDSKSAIEEIKKTEPPLRELIGVE